MISNKLNNAAIIMTAFFWSLLLASSSFAWVTSPVTFGRTSQQTSSSLAKFETMEHSFGRSRTMLMLDNTNEGGEPEYDLFDDDCGDECEIDWDDMAEFDEDTTMMDKSTASQPTTDMQRLRLEMSWSIQEVEEDCIVDEPETCGSEKCPDCDGTGVVDCRFCQGTNVLRFEGEYHTCPVCHHGKEVCRSCRGTGWISPWAKSLHEEMQGPEMGEPEMGERTTI